MILFPLNVADRSEQSPIPAWEAIEHRQKAAANTWWLITQPDHAVLAGDLAAAISFPEIPRLDAEVLRAVSLHDQGWARFDAGMPDPAARPKAFFDVEPENILRAWLGSIEAAERSTALGGILVSEHFCRIGRGFLPSSQGKQETSKMIGKFLEGEAGRQERLAAQHSRPADEISLLVDVLQLCDLVSLYLCCGCPETVEFPQKFGGQTFILRCDRDLYRTEPSLFGKGLSVAVMARKHPSSGATDALSIPFLLA